MEITMTIMVTFDTGKVFYDRARDMHNAVPMAEEWLSLPFVVKVQIVNQQQVIWER